MDSTHRVMKKLAERLQIRLLERVLSSRPPHICSGCSLNTDDESKRASAESSIISSDISSDSVPSNGCETEYYSFTDCEETISFVELHQGDRAAAAGTSRAVSSCTVSSCTKTLRVLIERDASLDGWLADRDLSMTMAREEARRSHGSPAERHRRQTRILDYFGAAGSGEDNCVNGGVRANGGLPPSSETRPRLDEREDDGGEVARGKSSNPLINTMQLLRTLFNARVSLKRLPADRLKKLLFFTKYIEDCEQKPSADLVTYYCGKCKKAVPVGNSNFRSPSNCQKCNQLLNYQCLECSQVYGNYKQFRNHLYAKCNPTMHNYCLLCNFSSTLRKKIFKHLKGVHKISQTEIRKQLDNKLLVEKFVRKKKFTNKHQHLQKSTTTPNIKNELKIADVDSKYELTFCCAVAGCNYKCDSESIIIEHVKKKHETSDDFLRCGRCGKILKRQGLNRHIKCCTGTKRCSNYSFKKSKKPNIIHDVNDRLDLNALSTVTDYNYKCDFGSILNTQNRKTKAEKIINYAKCTKCGKKFKKHGLIIHTRSCTGIDKTSSNSSLKKSVKAEKSSATNDFKGILQASCPKCKKMESTLKFRLCRKCKRQLRFCCRICKLQSSSKSVNCNHVQSLFDNYTHQCAICSKAFAHSINLDNHTKYCVSKVFKCKFCSYQSKSRSNFRIHLKTHESDSEDSL